MTATNDDNDTPADSVVPKSEDTAVAADTNGAALNDAPPNKGSNNCAGVYTDGAGAGAGPGEDDDVINALFPDDINENDNDSNENVNNDDSSNKNTAATTALLTRILGEGVMRATNGDTELLVEESKDLLQEHLTQLMQLESKCEQTIFNETIRLQKIQGEIQDVKFLIFGPPKILPPPTPPPSPPPQIETDNAAVTDDNEDEDEYNQNNPENDMDDEPPSKFQRTNENNRLAAVAAAALASGETPRKYNKRKNKEEPQPADDYDTAADPEAEEETEVIDETHKRGPKRDRNCSLVCFKCAATVMIDCGFKCPPLILELRLNDPNTKRQFPNIHARMENENVPAINVIDYRDNNRWTQECKKHNISDSNRKMFISSLRVHYCNVHHREKLPEFAYFSKIHAFGEALNEVNERYKPYRNGAPSVLTRKTFQKYLKSHPSIHAVLINAKKYALQAHEHKNVSMNLINNYFHHVRNLPGSNVTFENEMDFEQYPYIPYRNNTISASGDDDTESDDSENEGSGNRAQNASDREKNDLLRWVE